MRQLINNLNNVIKKYDRKITKKTIIEMNNSLIFRYYGFFKTTEHFFY